MFLSSCASIDVQQLDKNYELVVDAGSSGSRVFVYEKLFTESGIAVNSIYESKINIALASVMNDEEFVGVNVINTLLENSIKFIHDHNQNQNLNNIRTSVLGTAGMRLVSESQQQIIYKKVTQLILKNKLQLGEVKTITGADEGIYSWSSINYLLGNFTHHTGTNGVIEVGGASTQISFATPEESGKNISKIIINNHPYYLYSISFLGLGQNEARNSMLHNFSGNACYPSKYINTRNNIYGNFYYAECYSNYRSTIESFTEIKSIQKKLSTIDMNFIGLSSVFYNMNYWGISDNPWLLKQIVNKYCSKGQNEVLAVSTDRYEVEDRCANSVFIDALIFGSLTIDYNKLLVLNDIGNKSTSWTLGYILVTN